MSMKKIIVSALSTAIAVSAALLPATGAMAQYYDGRQNWDHRGPPPPPRHHHRDNTGRVIAGGLAAGVVGGLIGGALANGGGGPRYVEPPPPRPRCWYEDRRVGNAYDGGWHTETVRICQ